MTQKQTFARFPGYILFAIVDDPVQRPGWDILDILVADRVESHYEAVGVAQGTPTVNGSYGNSPMVMDGNRHYVVRKAQFLMGQTEKNLIVDYEDKLKAHAKTATEAVKTMDEFSKKAAVAEARVSGLEADRDRALKERQTLTTVQNKLEADMAKLKKMLGEKTINDVLNPTA